MILTYFCMNLKKFVKRMYRKLIGWFGIPLRTLLSPKNSRSGTAFIVFGPESSGTRMLTRFLIGCGCLGQGDHQQVLDYENPPRDANLVVWRRSIPHEYMNHPNILGMAKLMKKLGYNVVLVPIIRDPETTMKSQVENNHVKNMVSARTNVLKARSYIDSILSKNYFKVFKINYERFVKEKDYRKDFATKMGLVCREVESYKNMNEKYL